MSSLATPAVENLILSINSETRVNASLDHTFEALLEQLGEGADTPEGKAMPMKIEPWPGGRWYRDLGDNNGHFWANVQAIKRPSLLELHGPLFMSYAAISNVQYRLTEVEGGTLITFHHFALGAIPDDVRKNINTGWNYIHSRVRDRAEKKR